MTYNPQIYVIDHRDTDFQKEGLMIRVFGMAPWCEPGPRYADYCALYEIWAHHVMYDSPSDIIGFFGYRKYLALPTNDSIRAAVLDVIGATPAHAPDWYQCPKEGFDWYRDRLAKKDGKGIKSALAQCDIIQAAPFPLTEGVWTDFAKSRSHKDAQYCKNALSQRFERFSSTKIYPYIFITRWPVFDRMMRELEPIRQKLDELITAEDSTDEAYAKRPMAYVMERVYSLWLENSGLEIKQTPLLHCWEMQQ